MPVADNKALCPQERQTCLKLIRVKGLLLLAFTGDKTFFVGVLKCREAVSTMVTMAAFTRTGEDPS